MTGGDGNILFTVDHVAHRARRDLTAKAGFPKKGSASCVKRVEMTFASSGEKQIRRGGENATIGDIGHWKLPLLLSSAWIQRDHCAMPRGLSPDVDRAAT